MKDDVSSLANGLYDNGLSDVFCAVNCEKQNDVSKKFNIQGFPTIYLSVGGKTEQYNGARTVDSFLEFLCTNLQKCIEKKQL